MADGDVTREGGCLCGAVRFEARGEPLWVAHCHCTSCRKTTAAAFTTYAGYTPEAVTWSGEALKIHKSSPDVERGFCPRCGSSLTYASDRWPGEIHLFASTFDTPGDLKPRAHVFVAERLPWVHLADGLPEFATTSPEHEG